MKKTMTIRMLVCAVLVSGMAMACGDDATYSSNAQDCGQGGQSAEFDGQDFCLYDQGIIEEGFMCPPDMVQRHDFDGFVACGPDGDLPDNFEQRARDEGDFEFSDAPNNNITDPDKPEPDPNNNVTDPDEGSNNDPIPTDPIVGTQLGTCTDEELMPFPPVDLTLFAGAGYLGDADGIPNFNSSEPALVIEDEQTWQTVQSQFQIYGSTQPEDLDFSDEQIDFANERVVIFSHSVSSSCYDIEHSTTMGGLGDETHVQVSFTVPDGTCDATCDAEAHTMVIIRLPGTGTEDLALCKRVEELCVDE